MVEPATASSASARAELDSYFSLTDRFHAELAGLATNVVPVRVSAVVPSAADSDIEAVAFTVMMMAAKSAREDLRGVMARVKAINHAKVGLRKRLQPGKRPPTIHDAALDVETLLQLATTLYATEIENEVRELLADQLDSLSELGEMDSLRLQMLMDRLSKMMSTLSNVLKKISDTQSAIVQNLK